MNFPFDINLGYLKYINCVGENKPFSFLESRKIVDFEGNELFETLSKANSELGLIEPPKSVLYGDSFSCGTDESRLGSVLKCISEGLERWAYYSTFEKNVESLRFDLNPTSTGFAAYPGLLKNNVRSIAKFEALERWTIINWWLGKVRSRHCAIRENKEGVLSIFELACDTDKFFVGLLHFKFELNEEFLCHAYSFAAGPTLDHAVKRAKVELDRNINSLKRFFQNRQVSPVQVSAVEEARLIFFSKPDGFQLFQDKIKFTQGVSTNYSNLETVVDCEVVGDWSKYTNVWRYLYKNSHCDDYDHNFFFF